jgi:hypothetical protein
MRIEEVPLDAAVAAWSRIGSAAGQKLVVVP